jgi:hypothetical protein
LKNIFMLQNLKHILHQVLLPGRSIMPIRGTVPQPNNQSFKAIGINDFLNIDIPAREMLLSPILPERSLAMLYAPRGVGRSWLGLSVHRIGRCGGRIPSSMVSQRLGKETFCM